MKPWTTVVLVGVAALGISVSQARTRAIHAALRVEDDTYPLPPPHHVARLSLGYHSAVADFLYAHVLVSYGIHFEEKRRFEHVGRYLDTIATLDPTFAQTYLYADTLITLQPKPPREEDYEAARQLLLRGTRELPTDQRIWLTAGQFIGYLAPPRFDSEQKRKEWQLEGAELLAKACELASDNRNIPYHCLAAATTLNRVGQREALIQMLTRTLAVNDDPEVRGDALQALYAWAGEQAQEQASLQRAQLEATWRQRFGFVGAEAALTWGAPWSNKCLTDASLARSAACATSWSDFAARSVASPE